MTIPFNFCHLPLVISLGVYMSEKGDLASNARMMNYSYQNGKPHSLNIRRAGLIWLPIFSSNSNFHVTSPMFQLLKMKGSFRWLVYEDPDEHLRNFMDVCELFTFWGVT